LGCAVINGATEQGQLHWLSGRHSSGHGCEAPPAKGGGKTERALARRLAGHMQAAGQSPAVQQ
jgi:hypothetical protein